MKSVLISIQPKWCELIASGKKTVEVRKTKPTGNIPFKCYIYCTKAKEHFSIGGGVYATSDTLYRLPTGEIKFGDGFELMGDWSGQYDESNFLNGKVIGEFVCDRVYDLKCLPNEYSGKPVGTYEQFICENSCLSFDDIKAYGKGTSIYGWHITDLVVYDKPRELNEFKKPCNRSNDCCTCDRYDYIGHRCYDEITRPPQSWCYVEGAE